jgi:SAM-dependent methyltransferase
MSDPSAKGPFGDVYAGVYDATYAEKDYDGECDLVEEALMRYGPKGSRALLDLGCGSGGHVMPLARRGYELVGVDRSPSMLGIARDKIAEAGMTVELHEGDVRRVRLDRKFDAALLMFAVLGYQSSNADVLAALRAARAHLHVGGLLCFDVWYGPAVLAIEPEERKRTIDTPSGPVERSASAELDIRRQLCTVRYRFEGQLSRTSVAEEVHVMRFFFPMELELFLDAADLELVSLSRFGSLDEEPDVQTWNVFGVARAT